MKRILLGLILGLVITSTLSYAGLELNTDGSYTYTIKLTAEEYKVLEWQLVNPEEWITTAIKNKINKSQERMLLELTDKRPEKLTQEEKETLIKNSILKTRVEREAELK